MGSYLSLTEDSSAPAHAKPTFSPKFLAKYHVVRKIGEGGFGCAFEVRDRFTNAVWCAKTIRSNSNAAMSEVTEMKKFDNPHIVQFREAIVDTTTRQIHIVMEFCEGGTLKSWIKRNRRHLMLTEPAVHSCHELHTIHRDLKPDNVLLTRDRTIKLCDFGVARQLNENSAAASFCGTPPYMAPEVFIAFLRHCRGQAVEGYTYKSEVWSIGCMVLDMATVKGVFERTINLGLNAAEAVHGSQTSKPPLPDIQQIVEEEIPEDYRIIIRLLPQMLDLNSDTRISLEAILTDPDVRRALETPNERRWYDSLGEGLGLPEEGSPV